MVKSEVFIEELPRPFRDVNKRFVKNIVLKSAKKLDLDNVIITVILTGNERITEINKKYRKKNRPTDVISFANRDDDFPVPRGGAEYLGDIFISLETAEEQSQKAGVPLKDEVKRLVIHGLLHLAGYDHEKSEKDALIMGKKEEELFSL